MYCVDCYISCPGSLSVEGSCSVYGSLLYFSLTLLFVMFHILSYLISSAGRSIDNLLLFEALLCVLRALPSSSILYCCCMYGAGFERFGNNFSHVGDDKIHIYVFFAGTNLVTHEEVGIKLVLSCLMYKPSVCVVWCTCLPSRVIDCISTYQTKHIAHAPLLATEVRMVETGRLQQHLSSITSLFSL